MKQYIISGLISAGIMLAGLFFVFPHVPTEVPAPGAVSTPEFYTQAAFYAGQLNRNQVSTSSQGSSITVTAAEFTGWANASMVSYAPGILATTLTLPASSTLRSLLPRPGDSQSFCFRNATSTAASGLTFAGGTGTNLVVASSSVSALGGKLLGTGKIGCFTLIREATTSTTFDIDALLTVYQ